MKKISSILVLMLIALMLFVSCNNSTPTKEESNSSSNDSTPTVTERVATDDDYTLFITLGNVLIEDLTNRETLPEGCTLNPAKSTNTLSLTFNSCEFYSYDIDGSTLKVKLNGSATERTEGDPKSENYVEYYTCSFTEGSSLGDTKFTANFEYSINKSMEINITSATINGVKINGLSDLVESKKSRVATTDDIEITKKLLNVFDNINALTLEEKQALQTSGQLDIDYDSEGNPTYIFNNFNQSYSGTNYFLNGTVTVITNPDSSFSIECDFMNNGTKLDNKNYSIMANGIQKLVGGNVIFTFSEAIINCTNITGLQVTIQLPPTTP